MISQPCGFHGGGWGEGEQNWLRRGTRKILAHSRCSVSDLGGAAWNLLSFFYEES